MKKTIEHKSATRVSRKGPTGPGIPAIQIKPGFPPISLEALDNRIQVSTALSSVQKGTFQEALRRGPTEALQALETMRTRELALPNESPRVPGEVSQVPAPIELPFREEEQTEEEQTEEQQNWTLGADRPMQNIVFQASLFANEKDRLRSQKVLLILLRALVETNEDFLSRFPRTPPLYQSGVRYQEERGTEEWKSIPVLLREGVGDCEDLAAWRVAELRVKGIDARPYLKFKKKGNFFLYHVVVRLPDGRFEDPSRKLGMGSET